MTVGRKNASLIGGAQARRLGLVVVIAIGCAGAAAQTPARELVILD